MKKGIGSFESRVPKVRINKELNKYNNVVLFPEKLAKANEAIKKPGFKKLMDSIDALKEKESK